MSAFILHIVSGLISNPDQPRKPAFLDLSQTYLSYSSGGSTDHYLFLFGIFGFEKRLQEADILMLGTSHMEFGLSAELLSKLIATHLNKPFRVFNASTGFADGARFAGEILAANNIKDKAVIVDLLAQFGNEVSPFARAVLNANTLRAYFAVGEIWWGFTRDWLLDGILPRIVFSNGFRFDRFLNVEAAYRRWDTGDLEMFWSPTRGIIWPTSPSLKIAAIGRVSPFATKPNELVVLPQQAKDIFRANRIRPILTLVPFDGYDLALAESVAAAAGYPFVGVLRKDLMTWDTHHLTKESAELATWQLFQGIQRQGLLP